jgi:hypothetical protein
MHGKKNVFITQYSGQIVNRLSFIQAGMKGIWA